MLPSGTGAALGAPLRTAGGWKTGAPAVGETPAFGAPPALGAPPASGLVLRFILEQHLGTIPSLGMMDWGWISLILAGE